MPPVIRILDGKGVKTLKLMKCHCLNTTKRDLLDYPQFKLGELARFLKTCGNLTSLQCNHMCCDSTLEVIAKSCPHLENLSIYSCPDVTDTGAFYLAGHEPNHETFTKIVKEEKIPSKSVCTKLKKIKLWYTKISVQGALILFCIFPSIEEFEIFNEPHLITEDVFKLLYGTDVEKHSEITRRHSIKVFTCRSTSVPTKKEILSSIVKTCPHLENISLVCNGTKKEDTYLLAHLLSVNIVTLKVVNCNIRALLRYLKRKGANLLNLAVYQFSGMPKNLEFTRTDLQNIIYLCPKLETFTLKLLDSSIKPDVSYSEPGVVYFETLTHLSLEDVEVTPEDLKVLVSKCKNLSDLQIKSPSFDSIMDDQSLCDLLDSGSLDNLETLYLHKATITMMGLHRLLAKCSLLRDVGPVSFWAIESCEYEALIKQIREIGWEIDICAF